MDGKTRPDVRILDLQMLKVSKPVLDINFFICELPHLNNDVVEIHRMLRFYYDCLTMDTEAFGYDLKDFYSFDTFMKDYNDVYAFGFVTGLLCMVNI